MNKHLNQEDWATRGALAVKFGALMSVLSVIAVVSAHMPLYDEAMVLSTPAVASEGSAVNQPYYFPSGYELKAPESGESAPTF